METSSYYGDLGIFLYFAPIMSSLMAAFALLVNRRRTYSQGWLAGVFLTLGVGMICSFLFDRYMSADHTDIFRTTNFITSSAAVVSILWYYISLMRPQRLTRRFLLWAGAGWLLFALMAALPEIVSLRLRPVPGIHVITDFSSPWFLFRLLTNLCLMGVEVGLAVFIIRMYRRHCKLVEENFSFTEGVSLSWVSYTMALFILLGVLDALWMVNSTTAYKMLFNVASLVVILVLFWFGFRQGEIPLSDLSGDLSGERLPGRGAISLPGRRAAASLPEDERTMKLKADLLRYFQTKHPFLNPELSLRDVAQMLGISHYTLSRFINKEFGVNFYTLVSGYRVEYVLHLIELNRHTMNGDMLFAASGFKSRTVFFEQFKEKTGCTPQEYIAKKQKEAEKKGRKKKKSLLFPE